jgi:hypothetical protein
MRSYHRFKRVILTSYPCFATRVQPILKRKNELFPADKPKHYFGRFIYAAAFRRFVFCSTSVAEVVVER